MVSVQGADAIKHFTQIYFLVTLLTVYKKAPSKFDGAFYNYFIYTIPWHFIASASLSKAARFAPAT